MDYLEINEFFIHNSNCFDLNQDQIRNMQMSLIKESFAYHFKHSKKYKDYCSLFSVKPEDIIDYNSLSKIPLLSSSLFKLSAIKNDSIDQYECYESSGTKGSISRVFKDKATDLHFEKLLKYSLVNYFNLDFDHTYAIHLGQSPRYNHMWLSSAIDKISGYMPLEHIIGDTFKFDLEYTLTRIQKKICDYESLLILGAPILILWLLNYMEKNEIEIQACQNLMIITAGGWKKYSGEAIDREDMYQLLSKHFIGFNSKNFSDVYNCAETNNLYMECQNHNKHVYPWVKVSILNPETMEEVKDGTEGLIAILDPTIFSYPGFLLTDDIGVMQDNCTCGRFGKTLEVRRRVVSDEMRGCSLKLDLQSQLQNN